MSAELDERATALVSAHPGAGVERLFALVDELVDDSVDQRQALRALIRADRRTRFVVCQEDLRSGTHWRGLPALVEVVVPITADVALHVELAPVPTPTLVTWRQARGADVPVEVERLRAHWPVAEGGGPLDPSLARLAVALRHWQVGVPFAAGRVIEAIDAVATSGPLAGATALVGVVATATEAIEAELAGLPVDAVRRLDGLRSVVAGWAGNALAVWPQGAARWRAITEGLPAGFDEPDPATGSWAAEAADDVPVPTAPPYLYRGDAEPTLFLSGPVLLSRLFDATFVADIATSTAGRRVRLPLAAAVADALDAFRSATLDIAGSDDPLGAAIRAERSWWALRTVAVLAVDDPAPDADLTDRSHGLPSFAVIGLHRGETVVRSPLGLDAQAGWFEASLDPESEIDTLLVVLGDEPDVDLDQMHRWSDRLLVQEGPAMAAHGYAAVCAAAEPDLALGDEPDSRVAGIRALTAAKAAWCLRRSGTPGAEERREELAGLARELRPRLVGEVLDALDEPLATMTPGGDLLAARRGVTAAVAALIRADPAGDLLQDLRDLGAQLDALDRALLLPPTPC